MANFTPTSGFKDALLNGGGAADINRLSLHSATPTGGSNELSGSGYIQQPVAWATSDNEVSYLRAPVVWKVGVGPVAYVGGWHNGIFRGYWTPDEVLTFESPGYYVIGEGSLSI